MYITARLFHETGLMQDAEIVWGAVYDVHPTQHAAIGPRVQIVAGPHADFTVPGVYTIKLLESNGAAQLPFFNQEYRSGFGYSDVKTCDRHSDTIQCVSR